MTGAGGDGMVTCHVEYHSAAWNHLVEDGWRTHLLYQDGGRRIAIMVDDCPMRQRAAQWY